MNKRTTDFEIIARAVIFKGNRILTCLARKRRPYYYLPGGHIEFGEKARDAISRELREELGVGPRNTKLIGVVENLFAQDGAWHHEFNLIFEVTLKHMKFAVEDELGVYWLPFKRVRFLPLALCRALLKWRKDRQFFYASEIPRRPPSRKLENQ